MWLRGKDSACNAGDPGLTPGSGTIPWRRAWQPTPVFSPGGAHGQRSLVGYSSGGCKELGTAEVTEHTHRTARRIKCGYCTFCKSEKY